MCDLLWLTTSYVLITYWRNTYFLLCTLFFAHSWSYMCVPSSMRHLIEQDVWSLQKYNSSILWTPLCPLHHTPTERVHSWLHHLHSYHTHFSYTLRFNATLNVISLLCTNTNTNTRTLHHQHPQLPEVIKLRVLHWRAPSLVRHRIKNLETLV